MRWNYLCGSHRVRADLMLVWPHLYSGGLGLGLASEARARHLVKQLHDVPHVAVDPRLQRLQLPEDELYSESLCVQFTPVTSPGYRVDLGLEELRRGLHASARARPRPWPGSGGCRGGLASH